MRERRPDSRSLIESIHSFIIPRDGDLSLIITKAAIDGASIATLIQAGKYFHTEESLQALSLGSVGLIIFGIGISVPKCYRILNESLGK